MLCFLCVVFLWDVTSLSLNRISSFKRSWKFVMGVSTCLYDLQVTWKPEIQYWRSSQTEFSLQHVYSTSHRPNGCSGTSHVLFALWATFSYFQAAGASQPDAVDYGGDELWPVVGLHLHHERRRHLRPVRQRRPAVPQVKWDRRRINQYDALERSNQILQNCTNL